MSQIDQRQIPDLSSSGQVQDPRQVTGIRLRPSPGARPKPSNPPLPLAPA